MRNKILFILIPLLLSITISCDKDNDKESQETVTELNGTYKGTFTVEYLVDSEFYDETILSNEVIVSFENNQYSCSSNENHVPAGGSGTFVLNDYTISFEDENAWFADFDWNLVMDGEYMIYKTNSNIVIKAMKETGIYKYKLEKQ